MDEFAPCGGGSFHTFALHSDSLRWSEPHPLCLVATAGQRALLPGFLRPFHSFDPVLGYILGAAPSVRDLRRLLVLQLGPKSELGFASFWNPHHCGACGDFPGHRSHVG